jgi:hypothetical protein
MRLRSLFSLSVAILATTIASGCSNDSSTAPQSPAPIAPTATASRSQVLSTPIQAIPALRKVPLASDITVSKNIGILGGTLSIPQAGITVVVPPLAVTKNTAFSMTARAGSQVAYDFAPHGTKFLLPLVMTQNLTGIQGGNSLLSVLQLGYYADGTHPTLVSELLSVNVDLLHLLGVSTIWHFSGYILMTGRSDSDK